MTLARRIVFILLAAVAAAVSSADTEDHRAWQHGVDLIRVGQRLLVVWGSPGNPPKANLGGDWQHDVYYAWLDADSKVAAPQVLVSRPEAQEPPSTAINASGTILMTSEDGDGGINQHAGLWDSSLKPVRAYPFMIRRGGHSGHAAAMGNRFLVAYSEGWVEGGGFLGRGTGKDVLARIVENDGTLRAEVKLTEAGDRNRDGWPLAAGSDRNWLVVWQRYPEMSLQAALINGAGRVAARRKIAEGLPVRYAYDVAFAPQVERYMIAGAKGEGGFVSLVNLKGEIVSIREGMPPIASEARIVIGSDGAHAIAVYPVRPRGVAVVRLSGGGAELLKVVDHPYTWDYTGTAGAFVGADRVLFATLSTTGLKLVHVDLGLR
jgi:hypothetical protein